MPENMVRLLLRYFERFVRRIKGLNFKETKEPTKRDDMILKRSSFKKVVQEIKLKRMNSVTDSIVFELI